MRTPLKIAVVLATVAASTIGVAPGHAVAAETASTQQAAALRCRYAIVGTNVRIRATPSINSTIVRVKQNGETVTGPLPCKATVRADNYWWVKLNLGSGGYAWVAEPYVHFVDVI